MDIQLKHSNVPGEVPLATELANGELAVNTADLALFFKDAAGAVTEFKSGIAVGATPPLAPTTGLLWVDTSSNPPALRVWSGAAWPAATRGDGVAIVDDVVTTPGTLTVADIDCGVMP